MSIGATASHRCFRSSMQADSRLGWANAIVNPTSNFCTFIARQHAMHAECDIVLADPSMSLSVTLWNECTSSNSFHNLTRAWPYFLYLMLLQNSKGNSLSGGSSRIFLCFGSIWPLASKNAWKCFDLDLWLSIIRLWSHHAPPTDGAHRVSRWNVWKVLGRHPTLVHNPRLEPQC